MAKASSQRDASRDTVFDVDTEKLARVYAQAALDAAGDQEDNVLEDLQAVVEEVLDKHPDLEQVFGSALVTQDEKMGMLDRLFGSRVSPSTLSFLKVLTKHGRLNVLRQVVRSAGQLWETRNNRIPVQVELALALDEGLHAELVNTLRESLGIEPIVTSSINPELIGGFVARIGDKVYDASTRATLERSRQAMVARAVEAIQGHPDQFVDKNSSDN